MIKIQRVNGKGNEKGRWRVREEEEEGRGEGRGEEKRGLKGRKEEVYFLNFS